MPAAAEQHASFEQVSKALADPQRFAILEAICGSGCEVGCKELVAKFPISQATISHHLKELINAGLIEGRKEGQCLFLTCRPGAVETYLSHLSRRLSPRGGAGDVTHGNPHG